MKTQSSFIHSSKGKTDIIILLVFLLLVLNVGESVGSVFAMQDNKKKSSPKPERSMLILFLTMSKLCPEFRYLSAT